MSVLGATTIPIELDGTLVVGPTDYGTMQIRPRYRSVTVDIGMGETRELLRRLTEYMTTWGYTSFVVGSTRFTRDTLGYFVEFGLDVAPDWFPAVSTYFTSSDVQAFAGELRAWLGGVGEHSSR